MIDRFTRSFEVTTDRQADEHIITGRAIHYDTPALIRAKTTSGETAEWYEAVDPVALIGCDTSDTPLLLEHDRKEVIARSRGGSLQFENKPDGLYVRAEMKTQKGRDVWESVKAGLLTAFSFAFPVDSEIMQDGTRDGKPFLRIRAIRRLLDVSVVFSPAYPGAFANARSADMVESILHREQTKKKLLILLEREKIK